MIQSPEQRFGISAAHGALYCGNPKRVCGPKHDCDGGGSKKQQQQFVTNGVPPLRLANV
jgi:hypothetical protein